MWDFVLIVLKLQSCVSLREKTSPSMKATQNKRRKYTAHYVYNTEHSKQRLLIMFIIMSQLSKDILSTFITLSTLSIAILTRTFFVYITKIVFLNKSLVLNLCNNQYNLFYRLNYLQISVYSSKKFVSLVYLCLYLILLIV